MLRKGVMPMPPARNISFWAAFLGRTKLPSGPVAVSSSPVLSFCRADLKLLDFLANLVVSIILFSVGEAEMVNQRLEPRLSGWSCGRLHSKNCPGTN